jgi:sigma-B regulation protein RsbU (phosphoserine phosphatase)
VNDRTGCLTPGELHLDLSGALHIERAVDLVLEALVGPVVDWGQLTLVDRHQLVFSSRDLLGHFTSARLPAAALPRSSSLGRTLSTGVTELVLVPDGDDSDSETLASAVPVEEFRSSLTSIRPMDVVTIALSARGATYGALTVAVRGGDGFDPEGIAALEEFSLRVAGALDTTRALAESRHVAAVLSRELSPPALPSLPGVELASYYSVAFEAEALGGDFYDVHGGPADQEPDGHWTAVVGDVCGKGVEAAVLTGKVRQTIRTAALIDRHPGQVLGLANRVLVADEETFVTAICARGHSDETGVHLEIAAAGHPEPLVVRLDGSVEQVAVAGTVLGLLPDAVYAAVRIDLAPGETCLFFTDGVAEAPGHRGRFGDDRMREVLLDTGPCDVRAQVESVAMALSAHLGDRPHDDIAILAVQAGPLQ